MVNMGHSVARGGLIVAACIVFAISATFCFLATMPNQALFLNSSRTWTELYRTEVSPADFTYSIIRIVTIAYLSLFLLYALSTIIRSSGPGNLHTHPNYLPMSVYLSFLISFLTTIIWLFLWDNEHLEASLFFALFSTVAMYIALGSAMHGLFTNQKALISHGHPNEYRWVYLLVINPLGMYAMWLTMESLHLLAIVLVYVGGVTQSAGGSISITILTAFLIGYSLIELSFFERYFRYLYTPFLVLIWSFAGILVGNLDWGNSNTVFIFGLICVTIVVFLLKVVLSVVRCIRKPLFLRANRVRNDKVLPVFPAQPVTIVPPPNYINQPNLPSWPTLAN